jgi:carboxyl-terminal processing protease
VVLRTVVGSNAEAAGLLRGDRILSVDGLTPSADASARHLTWAEAAEDGVIRALVLRAGSPPFTVDVMAGVSALDPLPRLTLFGDHGWLEVPSLVPHEVVTPVVHALVRAAEGAGVTRLIVDLRDDAGGSHLAAVAVAGAFMPVALEVITGPTLDLTLRFEAGTEAVLDAFGRTLERSAPIAAGSFAGELIVLINRRTASCAESLALALQADAGALLIGEATAGMADGVVTFLPLSGGMGLAITIGQVRDARFLPIAKRAVPDVWVVDDPMALAAGIDAPLELARSIAWPE